MYYEENQSIYLDGQWEEGEKWSKHWNNIEQFREQYEHPLWKKYLEEGCKEGHGGIDWLVFCDFIDAVKEERAGAVDVYDMATWICISALAEESIAMGGQPVAIPDFTNGAWINRK